MLALWEQLDVPAESIFSFLSECDLLAPYHPAVLDAYSEMYKRLTGRAFGAADDATLDRFGT